MTERPRDSLPEWIGLATSHKTARLVDEMLSKVVEGKFDRFELYPTTRRAFLRKGGIEYTGERLSREEYIGALARLETMAGIVHTKDEEQNGVINLGVKGRNYKIKVTTTRIPNGKYLSGEVTSD